MLEGQGLTGSMLGLAVPLGGWEVPACHDHMSPLFLLPRHPLRCQWRPGAAPTDMWSTCSPSDLWGSGIAYRWGSPMTAHVAAV
jgi:hypothetical protein